MSSLFSLISESSLYFIQYKLDSTLKVHYFTSFVIIVHYLEGLQKEGLLKVSLIASFGTKSIGHMMKLAAQCHSQCH